MIKWITLLFVIFTGGDSYAFECPPGDLILDRQGQVDSFSILYPGCTDIEGNLWLRYEDIKNFHGLQTIRHIQGELGIYYTKAVDLTGLDSLQSVNSIDIRSNPNLVNINALHQIHSLVNLNLEGNPKLANLSGLLSLIYVNTLTLKDIAITSLAILPASLSFKNITLWKLNGLEDLNGFPRGILFTEGIESITIRQVPNISNLSGMQGIKKIGALKLELSSAFTSLTGLDSLQELGDFSLSVSSPVSLTALSHLKIIKNIYISSWPHLPNLHGLESITSVNHLTLSGIVNLSGMENLRVIHGDLNLTSSDFIDVSGFLGLDSVYGDFTLAHCNEMFDLHGLESLKFIGGYFYVNLNRRLSSLSGLDSLNHVSTVHIIENIKLQDIKSFGEIKEIPGFLIIEGNPLLSDISGLKAIKKIGGGLKITGTSLDSVEGLNNIDTVMGYCNFSYMPSLSDASALSGLQYAGALEFDGNAELEELPDFLELQFIGGNFRISGNISLKSIYGLHYLRNYAGNIDIMNNPRLKSIDGLDSLTEYHGHYVRIIGNDSLSTCESEFLCDYIASSHINSWDYLFIMDNAPGCNSIEEVESQCEPLGIHDTELLDIRLFPNPANTIVTVLTDGKIDQCRVYDLSGRLVLSESDLSSNVFDISSLLPQLYTVVCISGGKTFTSKLLVNR